MLEKFTGKGGDFETEGFMACGHREVEVDVVGKSAENVERFLR